MGLFANLRKNKSELDDSDDCRLDLQQDVDPADLARLGPPTIGVEPDAPAGELPPPPEAPVPGTAAAEASVEATDKRGAAAWHLPDLGPDGRAPSSETPVVPLSQRLAFIGHRPPAGTEANTGTFSPGPVGPRADVLLEILGLLPGATWDEVRSAHRELIDGHRCDSLADPAHAQLADEIRREMNTAFAALRLLAAAH